LCFRDALHQILNRAKGLAFIPQVHFSAEALRMKNTAPAEAARTVHQLDLRERRLGRGQLLVPYKMLYKSPV